MNYLLEDKKLKLPDKNATIEEKRVIGKRILRSKTGLFVDKGMLKNRAKIRKFQKRFNIISKTGQVSELKFEVFKSEFVGLLASIFDGARATDKASDIPASAKYLFSSIIFLEIFGGYHPVDTVIRSILDNSLRDTMIKNDRQAMYAAGTIAHTSMYGAGLSLAGVSIPKVLLISIARGMTKLALNTIHKIIIDNEKKLVDNSSEEDVAKVKRAKATMIILLALHVVIFDMLTINTAHKLSQKNADTPSNKIWS